VYNEGANVSKADELTKCRAEVTEINFLNLE